MQLQRAQKPWTRQLERLDRSELTLALQTTMARL